MSTENVKGDHRTDHPVGSYKWVVREGTIPRDYLCTVCRNPLRKSRETIYAVATLADGHFACSQECLTMHLLGYDNCWW